MESAFNVDSDSNRTIMSLAIRLEPNEIGRMLIHAASDQRMDPDDLLQTYEDYGVCVLLACLRCYVFDATAEEQSTRIAVRGKIKRQRSRLKRKVRRLRVKTDKSNKRK